MWIRELWLLQPYELTAADTRAEASGFKLTEGASPMVSCTHWFPGYNFQSDFSIDFSHVFSHTLHSHLA